MPSIVKSLGLLADETRLRLLLLLRREELSVVELQPPISSAPAKPIIAMIPNQNARIKAFLPPATLPQLVKRRWRFRATH